MEYGHTANFTRHGFPRIRGFNAGFIAALLTFSFAVFSASFADNSAADELHLLVNGNAIHVNAPSGSHLNDKIRGWVSSTTGTW